MTNFRRINLEKEGRVTKSKRTTFHSYVNDGLIVERSKLGPKDYENVVYIGNDRFYGAVFIAYDSRPDLFTIYFGEAGDEFKDNGE